MRLLLQLQRVTVVSPAFLPRLVAEPTEPNLLRPKPPGSAISHFPLQHFLPPDPGAPLSQETLALMFCLCFHWCLHWSPCHHQPWAGCNSHQKEKLLTWDSNQLTSSTFVTIIYRCLLSLAPRTQDSIFPLVPPCNTCPLLWPTEA